MIRKKINPKSKAFTLVEILVVVFLGALIIIAAYTVYNASYKSYQVNSKSAELTQNARIALERMSREIRQTPKIVTTLTTYPTGTSVSSINFRDGHDLFTNPPPTCQYQYLTYYLQGTDLHRKLSHYYLATDPNTCVIYSAVGAIEAPADADDIKAQNISNLQIWGDGTVVIRLAVSNQTSTYQFETKVLARNL